MYKHIYGLYRDYFPYSPLRTSKQHGPSDGVPVELHCRRQSVDSMVDEYHGSSGDIGGIMAKKMETTI